MKNEQGIVSQITDITSNMESNYPEIYRFLDENPITIPSKAKPELTEQTLTEYLDDLKQLLKRHLKNHKINYHERS